MRTASLLCLAGVIACTAMAVVSAARGSWDVVWPWAGLAVSTMAHGLACLGQHLMEQRRQEWRRHAETQLRAIFTPRGGHQQEERAAALREWRS